MPCSRPPQLALGDIEAADLTVVPERGVIEAKPVAADLSRIADTPQVVRYWERYGLVLVTNFRGFLVIAKDESGRLIHRERFELATTETQFWAICARPERLPRDLEVRFHEFLTRVLLHNAPLSQPRDVAFFLASYAKDCLWRLESTPRLRAENPLRRFDSLALLRDSLEGALGVTFTTDKGLHFFHSTLVQTLFYGLFSAWVIWYRMPADRDRVATFSAHGAAWNLKLPVLRGLFEVIYTPGALDGLGIAQVMDWAADVLRRVDGRAFFARFREDRAVQYFYEPFLESFDPDLRRQLGVWYTPPEVVDYMVARVDQALKQDLGIPRGLADGRVHVLDPCCGTGSFILAVLERIGRTLAEEGDDALLGAEVKRAAMTRVHGFEIMPAPFVVAHLQVSLLLSQRFGAPLDDAGPHSRNRDEWASICLTNALTGHDARYDRQYPLPLPDLESEQKMAARIKRECPILVVIGNPPYNGFAGVDVSAEERGLTDIYRSARRVRVPEGQGLNDPYVRFWRMAERRIAEQSGIGVVCLITNYSWLDGLSFTGMREHVLERFDSLWIDCLNGDRYKTGKRTPDGRPDPSIFSTPQNREGIQVGTAITLAVRAGDPAPVLERAERFIGWWEDPPLAVDSTPRRARVRFRHFWGPEKLRQLAALAAAMNDRADDVDGDLPAPVDLDPDPAMGLPLLPATANLAYFDWPSLPELMPVSYPGVKTSRDDFLVDIDRERLEARIREYFDSEVTDAELAEKYPGVMIDSGQYVASKTRKHLSARGIKKELISEFEYRPFDRRWLYWEDTTYLVDRKRDELRPLTKIENSYIIWSHKSRRELSIANQVKKVPCIDLTDRNANAIPKFIIEDGDLLGGEAKPRPNLGQTAEHYINIISGNHADPNNSIYFHILSILNSWRFLTENSISIKQDWPRIPLPATAAALAQSAGLGRRVAALLDSDCPVPGVTEAPMRPGLARLGLLRVAPTGDSDGLAAEAGRERTRVPDQRVTAGWGHAGQNGVCMPGRGLTRSRTWTPEERAALEAEATALGLPSSELFRLLGDTCLDVHLNATTYWTAVPEAVWRFTIGGYQVLKKWLSYRELSLLGRPLHDTEARHFRTVTRRLAALLLLGPELDANYRECAAAALSRKGV